MQKLESIADNVGSILPGAVSFMGQAFGASKYENTAADILRDAGTTYGSIGGFGYQKYNDIDDAQYMHEEHKNNVNNTLGLMASGAATGAKFGWIGAGVGALAGLGAGIFGAGKRHAEARRELQEANYQRLMQNQFAYNDAATQAARADFRQKYGNYEAVPLIGAKKGFDGMNMISQAMSQNGMQPAMVMPEEEKIHKDGFGEHEAGKGGIPHEDTVHEMLEPGDTIVPPKYPDLLLRARNAINIQNVVTDAVNKNKGNNRQIAGNAAKSVLNQTRNELAGIRQEVHNRMQSENNQIDYTGIPHAAGGIDGLGWGNLLAGVTGGLVGLGQYLGAKGQRVKSPNTYVTNPYSQRAFDMLNGLRINSKPILDQIDREGANGRYRINTAGGLSGAQKYLANVAMVNNSQVAKANALANIQQQNNAYTSAAAQAYLASGAQEAGNRIQTNQWDLDYYSKAHAARQQGMQMGLYNSLNNLQQYIANANKLAMFGNMYKLYAQDMKNKTWALQNNKSYNG